MVLMETSARLGAAFEEVIVAAHGGAGWAFERLYRWLSPAVLSYARGQGVSDPEDAVGDIFMKAFQGIGTFEGTEEQFRSWVFTVAHHRIIDDRRRASRRPIADTMLEAAPDLAEAVDVEALAIGAVEGERLRAVLDELGPDQRDVLLLRVLADLSIEQTATALGKTEGAVKQLQRRALITVRQLLGVGVTQ